MKKTLIYSNLEIFISTDELEENEMIRGEIDSPKMEEKEMRVNIEEPIDHSWNTSLFNIQDGLG